MICFACALLLVSFYGSAQSVSYCLFSTCPFSYAFEVKSAQINIFHDLQVVRDKRTGKTKGYGFVSFANPADLAAALKEMNGKSFFY